MTHVTQEEIEKVKKLIEVLQMRQSLLSETTLISEDALCPICYAQQNGKQISPQVFTVSIFHFNSDVIFEPCLHQSCHSCIIQHLMSVKLCFYCKALITLVKTYDDRILYVNEPELSPSPSEPRIPLDTQTSNNETDNIENLE